MVGCGGTNAAIKSQRRGRLNPPYEALHTPLSHSATSFDTSLSRPV
jgi:hypothetical protein